MDLSRKAVLITGASNGIGAAMARSFSKRGAQVSLIARSADKLASVASETGAVHTVGDVTRAEDRKRAVEATMARYGRIDVLVNNAGVGMYVPAWKADMAEVRGLWELNYFAALELIQLVVPEMRKQGGGMIVNVSSIAGKVSLPWFTNYTASKFAVCAMTDSLRTELAPFHIRCMTVCPGYVKTHFQDNALSGRPPDRLWRLKSFALTAEQCAEAVARGVERDKRTVMVPWSGRPLAIAYALFPSVIDVFLARIYRSLKMD
jgi:short-subunit dehydrogenase